jgi:hypothetical protein
MVNKRILILKMHGTNIKKHNSLYVFDKWGKNVGHKKMQYHYNKRLSTRRAKLIRIIGDPHNQRPDKWGSTVNIW